MEALFITGAANTVTGTGCVQWLAAEEGGNTKGRSETVCYPLHNLVAITTLDEQRLSSADDSPTPTQRVVATLRGHTGQVNALASCPRAKELYSCSQDGTVRVWTCLPRLSKEASTSSVSDWSHLQTLTGLGASAVAITSLALGKNKTHILPSASIVAASDAHGKICIWLRRDSFIIGNEEQPTFSCTQTFTLPPAQTPHSLHLLHLPSTFANSEGTVALLVGSVDSRIHVYAVNAAALIANNGVEESDSNFVTVGALPGHEEWVTCLASMQRGQTSYVASGSKDCRVRVWKFTQFETGASSAAEAAASGKIDGIGPAGAVTLPDNNLDDDDDNEDELDLDADSGPGKAEAPPQEETTTEARLVFRSRDGTCVYSVFLETLLVGHDDWVTSVAWFPVEVTLGSTDNAPPPLRLFSCSMDRNMIVWQGAEERVATVVGGGASGVWVPISRMGDVGGLLGGSVGNNLLGFVGGCLSPDGSKILGIGYGGSFHLWTGKAEGGSSSSSSSGSSGGAMPVWRARPFLTGHFGSVSDVCWSEGGEYCVSVSADQTSRIWAAVSDNASGVLGQRWCEVSRPQIHGYDLTSLVLLPSDTGTGTKSAGSGMQSLVTAGEEKLIRGFQLPLEVQTGLERLCGIQLTVGAEASNAETRVGRAYIPELGLSNKPADLMSVAERAEQEGRNVSSLTWAQPPLEGQLADHTVWPETLKLFGHSNDVACLALSPLDGGRWLASACKARTMQTAAVFFWDTHTGTQRGQIHVHDSTVVTLSFSHDNGGYLASSGKDRTLCVYRANANANTITSKLPYELYAEVKGAHKRIVWDCDWAPQGGAAAAAAAAPLLLTASRDGLCKLWRVDDCGAEATAGGGAILPGSLQCLFFFSPFDGVAVTAVHFQPSNHSERLVLAAGAESGDISVWQIQSPGPATEVSAVLMASVPASQAHGAAVKRIRWRPTVAVTAHDAPTAVFASCGEDHTLRLFSVQL